MTTSSIRSRVFAACGLLGLAACQASPADKAPTKPDAAEAKAKAEPEPEANDGFTQAPPEAPGEPSPPPPWFSVDAFEHAAVIKQDQRSNKLPTGQSATMIVLELPAGTTPEQCMDSARAKLGETIEDLPETTTTPQGYLSMGGEGPNYEFTIVCGVAKDKPTMFLSYIQ